MAKYADIAGYRLEVPPWWDEVTTDELAACNGVGPDDWPSWRRAAVGRLLPWMTPGSIPRDVEYGRVATRSQRLAADRRLWRNWVRTIRARLGWHWYDWFTRGPRRAAYLADLAIARLAYRAVRIAGRRFAERQTGQPTPSTT